MRERLRDLMSWVESRDLRERALLLAACAAVLFGLWELALMEPLREKQKAIDTNLREIEEQLRSSEVQGERILQAHSADPNQELRKLAETLGGQIEVLDARIHEHTVSLIPPKEMARFLEELLNERTKLRLIRLENLGPEPMLEVPLATAGAEGSSSGLFRHGIVIEFRGGYLDTLRYLRALEGLPWNFFWEDLEYQVQEYPEGKITIRAYTVSTDEVWAGV